MTREQGGSLKVSLQNQDGSHTGYESLYVSYDGGATWHPNPRLQKTHPEIYEE